MLVTTSFSPRAEMRGDDATRHERCSIGRLDLHLAADAVLLFG
jgi:hypothetical protein